MTVPNPHDAATSVMHTPTPPEIDPEAPPPPSIDPDPPPAPDDDPGGPPRAPEGDPPARPPPVHVRAHRTPRTGSRLVPGDRIAALAGACAEALG